MNSFEVNKSAKVKKSTKNANKRRKKRKLNLNNPSNEPVSIERYAAINKMPPFMIWEEIKKGKLLAREIGGELYILPKKDSSQPTKKRVGASSGTTIPPKKSDANHWNGASSGSELPSLPEPSKGDFLSLDGSQSESPEVALLLDHLSIAKEENKEILKMAQKSLEQVKDITKEIVSAKDEVIQTKEDKIKLLEEKLKSKEEALNSANQKLEDLEMLTKTLSLKN